MKKLLCFIDDSPAERELFQDVFGAANGAFQVICAENFEQAQERIGQTDHIPDLFVLDLYFPERDDSGTPAPVFAENVSFSKDGGDLTRAFLNLETARRRYQALRIAAGQSPAGGLQLIRDVQQAYPCAPIITYTRKGTIEEAEQARKMGARRVLLKPSGEDWDDTRRLTQEKRLLLEAEFLRAMTLDPFEILTLITHFAAALEPAEDRAVIAAEVGRLRQQLHENDACRFSRDDIDLLMDAAAHPFIKALIYQLRSEAFFDAQGGKEVQP